MNALLKCSLRDARIVVLCYKIEEDEEEDDEGEQPSTSTAASKKSEEFDAIDWLFNQAICLVEQSHSSVYWLREKPLERLPVGCELSSVHPTVLHEMKLIYAEDPLKDLLKLLIEELPDDFDSSIIVELQYVPALDKLAAAFATLQASLDIPPPLPVSQDVLKTQLDLGLGSSSSQKENRPEWTAGTGEEAWEETMEDEEEEDPDSRPLSIVVLPFDEEAVYVASLYTDAIFSFDSKGMMRRMTSGEVLE